MRNYPLDLALYQPCPPEEFSDEFPANEAFAHDPSDGRKELRRQATLYKVTDDPEEADSVFNPKTTVAVAAAFLGISQRHYLRLVDAGVIARFDKGEVDLAVVRVDFLRHLGEYCTVPNDRTGGCYRYEHRQKVH